MERKWLWIAFIALCIILGLRAFTWIQYYSPEIGGHSTKEMVHGTATKPFVTRLLVPMTVAAIDGLLTDSMRAFIASSAASVQSFYAGIAHINIKANSVNNEILHLRAITAVVVALFLAGYGVVLYHLGRHFFPMSAFAAHASTLMGYALIPTGQWRAAFMYDAATLCLSASCFYALLVGRWPLFFIMFLLACLNKETAIYSLLLYVLCCHDRLEKRRFFTILFFQLLIYAVIAMYKYAVFYENPGGLAVNLFFQFFKSWTEITSLEQILIMITGLCLLCYRWSEKPEMLRRSSAVLVIATGVWIVFGMKYELRGLYEIFPIVTLLLTHTVLNVTGVEKARLLRNL